MKYVEWIEPFDTLPDGTTIGPVYCRLAVDQAILHRKNQVRGTDFTYESDEQALDDFLVVHWGKVVDIER